VARNKRALGQNISMLQNSVEPCCHSGTSFTYYSYFSSRSREMTDTQPESSTRRLLKLLSVWMSNADTHVSELTRNRSALLERAGPNSLGSSGSILAPIPSHMMQQTSKSILQPRSLGSSRQNDQATLCSGLEWIVAAWNRTRMCADVLSLPANTSTKTSHKTRGISRNV
jgi:hypothetical protein